MKQAVLAGLMVASAFTPFAAAGGARIVVRSPGGQTVVTLAIGGAGPAWSVAYRGVAVTSPAPIGLRFAGEAPPRLRIAAAARVVHDGRVTGLIGKASSARDRYAETTVRFTQASASRRIDLIMRAYDDGAAYRWRVHTRGGFRLAREVAGFGVSARAAVWAMPVRDYQSSYEEYYRSGPLAATLSPGGLVALPLLFHPAPHAWAALTEAALTDWAGLYVTPGADGHGLEGRLSPRLDQPGITVVGHAGVHDSPWRVVMLGDRPRALIESNLVQLLNPPPDARDWSWVHPGKTSFPWWNDYVWPGVRFTPGLNTATMLAYIDFCAENGVPYHTLDGFEGKAWYGGPIGPDGTPQDLTHATPAIDMPVVLAHARARGVRLRLWTHWKPLSEQLDRALDAWAAWGIEGFMVDFMNRDDQQMVQFYAEIARKAADHHLTVNFHGAFKPTGEIRTWPNMLSREAVRGTEYDKFENNPGSTPDHEAILPFTRMLAGPFDVHQGGFDAVTPARFRVRYTAPQVMGTRARALALYVVDENPLAMVADTPANYAGAAGWDFVRDVPTAWDETRVLAADVGRMIVVARRNGTEWWVGAIDGAAAREVTIDFAMLGDGDYRLHSFADSGQPNETAQADAIVRRGERLRLRLSEAGGYAARLTPIGVASKPGG